MPKRPRPADLAGLDVPALIVVAARSRAHNPGRVARRARDQLPGAAIATAAAATHHTMPTEDAHELAGYVTGFLSGVAQP